MSSHLQKQSTITKEYPLFHENQRALSFYYSSNGSSSGSDTIKIDKSFIDDLTADQSAMVSTILSIALHNGLGVIAEGVELKEQVTLLQSLGCVDIQGYYYSRPLPPRGNQGKIYNQSGMRYE
ncbi:EAL domain-containing protein [Bacillus sp. SCS-153A]|uniref:EAL domain-containing protein n=1 Tax=Rossellomorea sedimentorum TaxID=3115294 RepID=UPI0039068D64